MKKFIFILLIGFVMTACSEDKTKEDVSDVKITHETIKAKDGITKTVANIKVEGMMCETMCVGKVRTELSELDCVKNIEISFDSDQPIDIATVEFDGEKCNEKDMIDKIQNIGEGAYQVVSVDVLTYY